MTSSNSQSSPSAVECRIESRLSEIREIQIHPLQPGPTGSHPYVSSDDTSRFLSNMNWEVKFLHKNGIPYPGKKIFIIKKKYSITEKNV